MINLSHYAVCIHALIRKFAHGTVQKNCTSIYERIILPYTGNTENVRWIKYIAHKYGEIKCCGNQEKLVEINKTVYSKKGKNMWKKWKFRRKNIETRKKNSEMRTI